MSRKFGLLLTVLFLAAVFAFTLNRFKEADSFYHLAAGKLMVETRSIPHADVFSFTAAGHAWVAHEWLAEIILYTVWHAAGYWGEIIFCALLAICAYYLILRRALLEGASLIAALLSIFLLGSLTFELWIGRPQIFAYALFAAELYLLELYRRTGRKKFIWSVPGLILLWANLHASVILGVAAAAWYAAGAWLKQRRPDIFGSLSGGEDTRTLSFAALISFILSFLNPNGWNIWTYNFTVQKTLAVLQVEEWKPLEQFLGELGAKAFAVELGVVAVVFIWLFLTRRDRRDITAVGMVVGTALLPFLSVRHAGWWPLVAAAPLAALSRDLSPRLRALAVGTKAAAAMAFLGVMLLIWGILRIPHAYYNPDTVPVRAADFIQSSGLQGPMYDYYNFGGYFIWRFWPREKVFIDGRSEVFAGEPARDFVAIARGGGWDDLVNGKYHLNYFVLPYRPQELGRSLSRLYVELIKEGWTFVYWDDSAVIFIRPSKENLPIAAKYAIQYVGPWTDPASIPADQSRPAALELQKLMERSPESVIIRDYAARFLEAHSK